MKNYKKHNFIKKTQNIKNLNIEKPFQIKAFCAKA